MGSNGVARAPDSKIRSDRLRSEIAQLEARMTDCFRRWSIRSSKASDGNWLPSIRPLSRDDVLTLMQTLFIGQTYIDVTFLTDRMPTGDEKHVASAYAISFGGNAVTAAFCCAKLGLVPELLSTVADDWLGRMFLDMAEKYRIPIYPRKVRTSSLSFIMPNDGKRAIVRCRDDDYLDPFPRLNLFGCRALHLDGHQPDAAMYHAKVARQAGILTSLDGGGLRSNTHELLAFIDIAIVSERLCEQMRLDPARMLDYLKSRGCRIGGVTLGERGLVWYDETGVVANASSSCRAAGSCSRYEWRR